MNVKRFAVCAGLVTGGLLGLDANPVQAVGFQFTSECINESGQIGNHICQEQAPDGDILLRQVAIDGQSRNRLTLVDLAEIVENDEFTGGNTGAASADKGDEATLGLSEEDVTAEQIANADPNQQSALTNFNLNSIVDTEDEGEFKIDLFFQRAVDNVLLWERGMNSALTIQALDGDGNLFGTAVNLGNRAGRSLTGFTDWYDAGFAIDTLEIGSAQQVGSIGIGKSDFDLADNVRISGIRLISRSNYNGPDWKVIGTVDPRFGSGVLSEGVPEPFALAGLVVVGGAIAARRRRA